jgi:adenosylcobinamide amidohydrolase
MPRPAPRDEEPELVTPSGAAAPALVWRLGVPRRAVSSAPVGGGMGVVEWIINAQVDAGYERVDLDDHVAQLASALGCHGPGVGMLTAAPVARHRRATDAGVIVDATVGITIPTWAATPAGTDESLEAPRLGTINIVVSVDRAMSDAALVNAVMTATEAKAQALFEHAVPGTGTATDAVCIVAPLADDGARGHEIERFGGPRSAVGAPLARAVHAAVSAGLEDAS